MHPSIFFWLALSLPGFVAVRTFSREDLESGLLGTLGLAYIAVFTLLTPISIACYLFHAPVWVFTAACVVLILAAPIEISRRKLWRDAGKLLLTGATIEMLIVGIDLVLGARVGTTFAGDARVHLGRIRFFLDHGISNLDHYSAVPYFYPIYHTNILYPLHAAAAQLTDGNHIRVWHAALPWGKLLIAAGPFYLVWTVFNRRWPAWLSAVYVVAVQGPVTFLIYPNKLAPFWAAPYLFAFAVQACRPDAPRRAVVKLAAGALIIGQIHGLYALFSAACILPVLGGVFLGRLLRRRTSAWPMGLCTAAIGLALVFPGISQLKRTTGRKAAQARSAASQPAAPAQDGAQNSPYLRFDNGWLMLNPKLGLGPAGLWTTAALAAGVVAALLGRRRKDAVIALAIGGIALAVFYVPPLCALALRILGREWILSRCTFMVGLLFIVFAPGAIASLIEGRTKVWQVRAVLSIAVFVAAMFVRKAPPYTWKIYYTTARAPESLRRGAINSWERLREVFDRHLPDGQTVLVQGNLAINLVMLHDAYIVASISSSLGVPDLSQRHRDLAHMLNPGLPWSMRRQLLNKYDIHYCVFTQQAEPPDWSNWRTGRITRQPLGNGNTLVIARLVTEE